MDTKKKKRKKKEEERKRKRKPGERTVHDWSKGNFEQDKYTPKASVATKPQTKQLGTRIEKKKKRGKKNTIKKKGCALIKRTKGWARRNKTYKKNVFFKTEAQSVIQQSRPECPSTSRHGDGREPTNPRCNAAPPHPCWAKILLPWSASGGGNSLSLSLSLSPRSLSNDAGGIVVIGDLATYAGIDETGAAPFISGAPPCCPAPAPPGGLGSSLNGIVCESGDGTL